MIIAGWNSLHARYMKADIKDIAEQAVKKMDHDKRQTDFDKLKSRLMDLKGIGPVKAEQVIEVVKEVVE